MTPRRGATDLSAVVAVDKPSGMTSHDVVAKFRSATGERRIGHAGTLDPMATGLLIVLIGPATRLEQYLSAEDKSYLARIEFGTATDTLDAEGTAIDTAAVPDSVFDRELAESLLESFIGTSSQTPPAYSAIKRGGVSSHRMARAGQPIELEPRHVTVHEARLVDLDAASRSWDVAFRVSKGTYVRSLAADIGTAAGTVAHLAALRRTRIGEFPIASATPLPEALEAAAAGRLEDIRQDPAGLLGMPVLEVRPASMRDGRPLPVPPDLAREATRVALVADENLLAVYRREADLLVAETVFDRGVPR